MTNLTKFLCSEAVIRIFLALYSTKEKKDSYRNLAKTVTMSRGNMTKIIKRFKEAKLVTIKNSRPKMISLNEDGQIIAMKLSEIKELMK